MNSLESRLYELEKAVRKIQDDIRQLIARIGAAEQQPFAGGGDVSGGGDGGGSFRCTVPVGGIAGGSASTCTIEQLAGGVWAAIGSATVYNPMPDSCTAGFTLTLSPTGDGDYQALSQSCS